MLTRRTDVDKCVRRHDTERSWELLRVSVRRQRLEEETRLEWDEPQNHHRFIDDDVCLLKNEVKQVQWYPLERISS